MQTNQNVIPFYQQQSVGGSQQQQQLQVNSVQAGMNIHQAGTTFFQPTSGSSFNPTSTSPVFHSTTAYIQNPALTSAIEPVNFQLQPVSTINAQQTQQMRVLQSVTPSISVPVTTCQQGGQGGTILTALMNSQNSNGTMQILAQPNESDDRNLNLIDAYYVEHQVPTTSCVSTTVAVTSGPISIGNNPPTSLLSKFTNNKKSNQEKKEKDEAKRAKQAEAARLRYHRLSSEEKRELNVKRTLAQKRKRQREKELEELEDILRKTNDIQEDPEITEQLREKRMRARWAEAARTRYQRMSSEERRAHNNRRRLRQIAAVEGLRGPDGQPDEEAIKRHIKEQNAKKAEAARLRYHRMTEEEKKAYNQRRTEAFRRRRMEEEILLAMPIGRINGEALDRAQQIVIRNAKRAEAARLRYQKMTPEQRKLYNQKRYTPKRKREGTENGSQGGGSRGRRRNQDDAFDALTTLEKDVLKRTQQAQQALMRQRNSTTSTGTYLAAQNMQQPNNIVPTHVQQHQTLQAQQVQAQTLSTIPQQVQFQLQPIHPQQIQQPQQHQEQQRTLQQQQIQYNVQVPNSQMMVGQHIQQQILAPYTAVAQRGS